MAQSEDNEDPYFAKISARLTWLLAGQTVEWCRQDSDRNLTIKFAKGPMVHIDIPTSQRKELDISVVSSHDADSAWDAHAESQDAPPPPGRRKR